MQDMSSQFKPVSVARVLEDLEPGTEILLVGGLESNPGATGMQVSNTQSVEAKGTDASGKEYSSTTTTDSVIKAKWLRWGSQRLTPPNVRRKMRVMLYRFADQDEYYWEYMGLDGHLMRLETIVWGINNNANADGTSEVKPENMHTIEWSSHTKQLTLRTCKSQGEPFAYIFQFNLGEGAVILADDTGNMVNLDSQEAIWIMQNSFGSHLKIDKNNIFAFAAELIKMETKKVQVIAETVEVKANLFSGNVSELFHVDTPQANFTNNVTVGQINTGYNGNGHGMISKGNMRIEGELVTTGDAVIGGKITCAGIDSSQNVNAPNI